MQNWVCEDFADFEFRGLIPSEVIYSSSEKDFLQFSCRDVALQRLATAYLLQKDVALQRLYGEKHYLKNYSSR